MVMPITSLMLRAGRIQLVTPRPCGDRVCASGTRAGRGEAPEVRTACDIAEVYDSADGLLLEHSVA